MKYGPLACRRLDLPQVARLWFARLRDSAASSRALQIKALEKGLLR